MILEWILLIVIVAFALRGNGDTEPPEGAGTLPTRPDVPAGGEQAPPS